MLTSIAGDCSETLDEGRRRGLVEFDDAWVWYRHELVRTAVHDSLLDEQRRELNAAILEQLIAAGGDVARIVHHAGEAGDHGALARFAPVAARQAGAAAAHREALTHFRIAADHMGDLPVAQQASILTDFAVESYLGDEMGEALDLSARALELWRQLGDEERQGEVLRWQSRFYWWLGRADAAEQTGRAAVEVLEGVPDSDQLPMACSNLSQLAMLAQDFEPAVEWSTKAIDSARRRNDQSTLAHALNNLGSARIRVGDLTGFDLLRESLDIALRHGFDDHAGRAYANLIWTALDYRMYDVADEYLTDGIEYAAKRDLSGSLHYMVAERATLRLQRGDWAEAEADLQWVLAQPEQPGITQMPALATLARLAARRGDGDAPQKLQAASALAEPTGELQRIAPVAAARAELEWLQGNHEAVHTAVVGAYARAVALQQPWITDELAFWMWRSGASDFALRSTETPYALQIAGRWSDAAAAWAEVGCPYERATALYDSNNEDDLMTALEILDDLGAAPAARLVRSKLQRLGVRRIPRGPRRATRANPAGLTPRQMEVLGLIVGGLTNAEIADKLFVSPKTIDHHVSAILTKLEVASRHEAARAARRLGIVDV
jgi:DNA-binding CsgD family transcriptional regulator/tetratricopeptide (TPR) repeat protein